MSTGSSPLALFRGLVLMSGLMLGCEKEHVEHYAIQIVHLEFPDSVQAGAVDSLRVAAAVGYFGCKPEHVRIERRSDSLFVTGMAHCVDRYSSWKVSDPEVDTAPARPNPLGLRPVTVREIDGPRVKIGPIEVFDGTPVVDIKSASTRAHR